MLKMDTKSDYEKKLISSINNIDGNSEVESYGDFVKIVVFSIDNQDFAFDVADTESINRIPDVTRVPGAPGSVQGIINLRGKTILLLKLSFLLDLKEKCHTKKTRIINFDVNGESIAFVVDSIVQILTVKKNQIKPPADVGKSKIDMELILGGVILDDRIITLLNPKMLLSSRKLL